MITARRNDKAGPDLKRLGQHVRHVLDWSKEEVGGVLELCVPRKLRLPRRQLAPAIRVVFELGLELHLEHMRDELRSRFIGGLPEVLVDASALDEADLGTEVRADVLVNGHEAEEVVLE